MLNQEINVFWDWIVSNIFTILISIVYVVGGYIVYRLIKHQVKRLLKKEKVGERLGENFITATKWIIGLVIFGLILGQFGVTLEWIAAVFSLFGGTILGFAAINTFGNMIAGFIVRRSKPFKIGDRISLNGEFSDVIKMGLIYTTLVNLDKVKISIPNQKLLKMEIRTYGSNRIIRQTLEIIASNDIPFETVEQALIEATYDVERLLETPEPFMRIVDFPAYGVKYRLYYFIQDVAMINEIRGDVHISVFKSCQSYHIDLTTPLLHMEIDTKGKKEENESNENKKVEPLNLG